MSNISEYSGEPPADPETQAAVNDFLDYTEFFPSDLFRSLTLIGKLDNTYQEDAFKIHSLTKTYGTLPSIPDIARPDPSSLRKDVSSTLDHALRCRESTYAEALRICHVANTLYNRLIGIKAKLHAMPKPPSRDPSPVGPTRSPTTARSRRVDTDRTPRLKLLVDNDKSQTTGSRQANVPPKQKNRQRRIIVPGEVMPPYDPASPGASIASDSDSEPPSPAAPPPVKTIKLAHASRERATPFKMDKKLKSPKPATGGRVRPPGVMGTNVHSTVAGISVSNAMANLTPPPEHPQPGSEWAPWSHLTEWELNMIRRKMKKNANWQPSHIMKQRELALRGRGKENQNRARAAAAATGALFLDEPPHKSSGRGHVLFDAIPASSAAEESMMGELNDLVERPEGLGDKKRGKSNREAAMLREQAQMEEMSKIINQYGKSVEELYKGSPAFGSGAHAMGTPFTSPSAKKRGRKRKRESSRDFEENLPSDLYDNTPITQGEDLVGVIDPSLMADSAMASPSATKTRKSRVKDEPSSKKLRIALNSASSNGAGHKTITIPLAPAGIAPNENGARLKTPRLSRSSKAATPAIANGTTAPAASMTTGRKSAERNLDRSMSIKLSKRPISTEAPERRSSGRRISASNLAVGGKESRPLATGSAADGQGRRSIRGNLDHDDKIAKSGQRRTSSSKGTNHTAAKSTKEIGPTSEDEGEADEPRYCICNGFSSGDMVACDNDDCVKEWFHFECVGVTEMPKRTSKWYCPDCRKKLKVGENGQMR